MANDVEKKWVIILVFLVLAISVIGTWMTLSIVENVVKTTQTPAQPASATLSLEVLPQRAPPAETFRGGE